MINKHLIEGASLPIKPTTYICLLATIVVWSLTCLGNIVGEIVFYNAELEETLCLCGYNLIPPPPPPPCSVSKLKNEVEFYQNSSGEIKWIAQKNILPTCMSVRTVPKGIWTPIAVKSLPKGWQNFDDKTMRSIALNQIAIK